MVAVTRSKRADIAAAHSEAGKQLQPAATIPTTQKISDAPTPTLKNPCNTSHLKEVIFSTLTAACLSIPGALADAFQEEKIAASKKHVEKLMSRIGHLPSQCAPIDYHDILEFLTHIICKYCNAAWHNKFDSLTNKEFRMEIRRAAGKAALTQFESAYKNISNSSFGSLFEKLNTFQNTKTIGCSQASDEYVPYFEELFSHNIRMIQAFFKELKMTPDFMYSANKTIADQFNRFANCMAQKHPDRTMDICNHQGQPKNLDNIIEPLLAVFQNCSEKANELARGLPELLSTIAQDRTSEMATTPHYVETSEQAYWPTEYFIIGLMALTAIGFFIFSLTRTPAKRVIQKQFLGA